MSDVVKCMKCSSAIKKDEKNSKIKCNSCSREICVKCSELSATEMRVLGLQSSKIKYYCADCEEGLLSVPVLRNRISALENELANIKTQCTMGLNMDAVLQEMDERQYRSKNVIIFGINESASSSTEDRKKHDKLQVQKALEKIPDVDMEKSIVVRLGKPADNSAKPRPVKVILQNKHQAINVLKNKKKLPQNISASSDKTPYQRDQLRKLREELAERTDSGEKDLTIKYIKSVPRIVKAEKN